MDIVVDRALLASALSLSNQVANRRSTMPILANVLLRSIGDKLLIAASDLTSAISTETPAQIAKAGSLALNAKNLYDLVKSMSIAEVRLQSVDDVNAELRCGKTKLRLPGLPVHDFPKLPDHREATFSKVGAEALREMFKKTEFAICTDEQRAHLYGLHFECDGDSAMVVAGNAGGQVWMVRRFAGPKVKGVLLPKNAIHDILAAIEDAEQCEIAFTDAQVFVRIGQTVIAVQPGGGKWPTATLVNTLKNDRLHVAIVPRKEFISTMERASIVAKGRGGVRVEMINNTLIIAAEDMTTGTSSDEIACTYSDERFAIIAAANSWIEYMKILDGDEVEIACGSDENHIILRSVGDENQKSVVMPMKKVG